MPYLFLRWLCRFYFSTGIIFLGLDCTVILTFVVVQQVETIGPTTLAGAALQVPTRAMAHGKVSAVTMQAQ